MTLRPLRTPFTPSSAWGSMNTAGRGPAAASVGAGERLSGDSPISSSLCPNSHCFLSISPLKICSPFFSFFPPFPVTSLVSFFLAVLFLCSSLVLILFCLSSPPLPSLCCSLFLSSLIFSLLLPLPAPGNRRELAHQEHTNTGFEYFLCRERRVREPFRSSKSMGLSSSPQWLWLRLSELSMAALQVDLRDFPLHLSCPTRRHQQRSGVSHLLSNLEQGWGLGCQWRGRSHWRGGSLQPNSPGFLDGLVTD